MNHPQTSSSPRLLSRCQRIRLVVALAVVQATCVVSVHSAERLVATVAGDDINIGAGGAQTTITFDATEPVTGIGLTARWTAVVADNENGIAPWSLDLGVTVTAPDNSSTPMWRPIGGDITIADYPLQDVRSGFNAVAGQGAFTWSFSSQAPAPWVSGLRHVRYHLTTQVPDVEQVLNGSVASGPLWSRPYFIAGVSGLGPVVHDAIEFEVGISGGYAFESIVPAGNHFVFLYQGGFDPAQPLNNLLDYGMGNGFSHDGSPQGTSRIRALLLEGETYHLVASQWAPNQAGRDYVTTVIGPGPLLITNGDPIFADGFDTPKQATIP